VKKRLTNRSPQVQLLALTVCNSFSYEALLFWQFGLFL
jgi:hypothetical protein